MSKLLASLMRNYFPKRPSGAPLHTLSKLYDVPVGFVTPPPYFEAEYCLFCGRRRVAVARYRMICLVLHTCIHNGMIHFDYRNLCRNQLLLFSHHVIYDALATWSANVDMYYGENNTSLPMDNLHSLTPSKNPTDLKHSLYFRTSLHDTRVWLHHSYMVPLYICLLLFPVDTANLLQLMAFVLCVFGSSYRYNHSDK